MESVLDSMFPYIMSLWVRGSYLPKSNGFHLAAVSSYHFVFVSASCSLPFRTKNPNNVFAIINLRILEQTVVLFKNDHNFLNSSFIKLFYYSVGLFDLLFSGTLSSTILGASFLWEFLIFHCCW